jgi:hypothetical protein
VAKLPPIGEHDTGCGKSILAILATFWTLVGLYMLAKPGPGDEFLDRDQH